MAKSPDVSSVSGALVAKCCGISRQTHAVLVRSKAMPRSDKAQGYDLVASVQAFTRYCKDAGTSELQKAKLQKLRAESKRIALQNALSEGETVNAELSKQMMLGAISALAEALESIPQRVTTDERLQKKIEDEITVARNIFADALRSMADRYAEAGNET